jgi:hypothetical protein
MANVRFSLGLDFSFLQSVVWIELVQDGEIPLNKNQTERSFFIFVDSLRESKSLRLTNLIIVTLASHLFRPDSRWHSSFTA